MPTDQPGVTRRNLVVAAAASAALGCASQSQAAPARVVIEGVPPYGVYDPLFESVRVALSKRGERCTPAYVQGISGAFFRLGGPCPCAPTCVYAMQVKDLIALLGYDVEALTFEPKKQDPKERMKEVASRIKSEIRARRPVVAFHAFTSAEFDVICGYDDTSGEFLGRGAYGSMLGKEYARADQGRMITCTDICPIGEAYVIGKKTGKLDARRAEIAALQGAVRHSRDKTATRHPYAGLQVYDVWLKDWAADDAKPDWLRDGYGASVYSSTHAAGADFLRQMKRKYRPAAADLEQAAIHLAAEAEALHGILAALFPPKDKPKLEREAAQNLMKHSLNRARTEYAAAADAIEAALGHIRS